MSNCICRICKNLIEVGLGTMTRGCPFCYRMYLINLADGPLGVGTTSYTDIEGSKKRYHSLELEN